MKTDTIALLNEAAALIIFAAGLLIHFFFRPRVFKEHPYTRYAFQFWLLRWLIFSFAWFLIHAEANPTLVLAVADLGTVAFLGFCWSFHAGDELKVSKLVLHQALVYVLLTLCNLYLALFRYSPEDWAKASAITAAAASAIMAFLFLVRYRFGGIPIALVEFAYAVLQGPAYSLVFGKGYSNPPSMSASVDPALVGPMIGLAAAKVLTGIIFYAMFFVPLKDHRPIGRKSIGLAQWPIPYPRSRSGRALIQICLLVIVGIIAKGIIDWTWRIYRSGDQGKQVVTGITTAAAIVVLILPILLMLVGTFIQWVMRRSPKKITVRRSDGLELEIEFDPTSLESIRRTIDSLVDADTTSKVC